MEAHSIWQKLQSKLSVFLNFHLTYMNSYCFIMRITSYLCVCVYKHICVQCVCWCGTCYSCSCPSILQVTLYEVLCHCWGVSGKWMHVVPGQTLPGDDGQAVTVQWAKQWLRHRILSGLPGGARKGFLEEVKSMLRSEAVGQPGHQGRWKRWGPTGRGREQLTAQRKWEADI